MKFIASVFQREPVEGLPSIHIAIILLTLHREAVMESNYSLALSE